MLLYPKKRDRHWRMQRATKVALCDRYYWEEYISEELLCSSSDYKRKVHSYKKEQKKSPYPAVAGLPNKDSGVRLWGLEPQTP